MLSAFKNFVITFLIAALVFGVVAYFATGFLENTMDAILRPDKTAETLPVSPIGTEPPVTTTPDLPNPPTNVPNGKSFTMLIAITDYQPELFHDYVPTTDYLTTILGSDLAYTQFLKQYRHTTASSLVLLRADKERQEFVITPISSIIKVQTPAGEMCLGDTFGYYSAEDDPTGMAYILSSIKALTGLGVDYYLRINVTELDEVIHELGAVTCELPCSVYSIGDVYSTVKPADDIVAPVVPAGKFTMASDTVMPLYLLSEQSEQGVKDKRSLLYAVSAACFKQIADMPEAQITNMLSLLLTSGYIQTNLTTDILASEMDLIKMYCEYTIKNVTYPVACPATVAGQPLTFVTPNITKAVSLFDVYR